MYRRVEDRSESITNFYTFIETVGEGGFGVVRRAENKETGETIAVKTIDKSYMDSEEVNNLDLQI